MSRLTQLLEMLEAGEWIGMHMRDGTLQAMRMSDPVRRRMELAVEKPGYDERFYLADLFQAPTEWCPADKHDDGTFELLDLPMSAAALWERRAASDAGMGLAEHISQVRRKDPVTGREVYLEEVYDFRHPVSMAQGSVLGLMIPRMWYDVFFRDEHDEIVRLGLIFAEHDDESQRWWMVFPAYGPMPMGLMTPTGPLRMSFSKEKPIPNVVKALLDHEHEMTLERPMPPQSRGYNDLSNMDGHRYDNMFPTQQEAVDWLYNRYLWAKQHQTEVELNTRVSWTEDRPLPSMMTPAAKVQPVLETKDGNQTDRPGSLT